MHQEKDDKCNYIALSTGHINNNKEKFVYAIRSCFEVAHEKAREKVIELSKTENPIPQTRYSQYYRINEDQQANSTCKTTKNNSTAENDNTSVSSDESYHSSAKKPSPTKVEETKARSMGTSLQVRVKPPLKKRNHVPNTPPVVSPVPTDSVLRRSKRS